MEATMYQKGETVDYTNPSTTTAIANGLVMQYGGRAAVVANGLDDIAASAQGGLAVEGVAEIQAAAVAANRGDNAYWDEDGNPYGGTSGSGCVTNNPAVADFWLGTFDRALTATDGKAYVALNVANPEIPAFLNRTHVKKTGDYTVLDTDCGTVIHCDGSAESDDIIVITMLATSPGFECIIMNDAADGASQITIEVNGSDKFCNPAALDDGDTLDNTLATAIRGDYVWLVGTTNGWYVKESRGIWADGGAS